MCTNWGLLAMKELIALGLCQSARTWRCGNPAVRVGVPGADCTARLGVIVHPGRPGCDAGSGRGSHALLPNLMTHELFRISAVVVAA
jgi:hypothetical protein